MTSRYHSTIFAIFVLVLTLTASLYWQGLNGVFIFDDEQNLGFLSLIDTTDYWSTVGQFLSEAVAGPLGRPISLLSFAVQHEAYPDNIRALKAVNVILHLINGSLIYLFIYLLTRLVKISQPHGLFFALTTASIWLLTPLQVSTVLYVIQRMTELSTLFSLLGLIVYLLGREAIAHAKPIRGFLLISSGIGFGILLASLSKENGILLALFVLVLEWTILADYTKPRYWSWWLGFFAYLPLLLLFLYFSGVLKTILQLPQNTLLLYTGLFAAILILIETIIWTWVKRGVWKNLFRALFYSPLILIILYYSSNPAVILDSYAIRDFTVIERLLTQGRILVEYLAKILWLYPSDYGLFHDDFIISRDLFTPISTLLSAVLLLILFGFAVWKRKAYPFISFGILWFFAGHILESSFIGLVLYFEHRNYLSSIGIIFAVVYGLWLFLQNTQQRYQFLLISLTTLWLIIGVSLTWTQINLWANPVEQAGIWAAQKPFSRYAQSQAASIAVQLNRADIAQQYYHQMLRNFPEDTDPYIMLLLLACHYPDEVIAPSIEQEILPNLQNQTVNTGTLSSLVELLEKWSTCRALSAQQLDTLFQALLQRAKKVHLGTLYRIYAYFKAQLGDYLAAIDSATQALEHSKRHSPELYFLRIKWAVAAQDAKLASMYLNATYQYFNPFREYAYHKQLAYWEMRIELLNQSQNNF